MRIMLETFRDLPAEKRMSSLPLWLAALNNVALLNVR